MKFITIISLLKIEKVLKVLKVNKMAAYNNVAPATLGTLSTLNFSHFWWGGEASLLSLISDNGNTENPDFTFFKLGHLIISQIHF